MTAYQEVEDLSETVRRHIGPAGIDALEQILMKCRGYMEADQNIKLPWLKTSPTRRAMFELLLRRRGQVVSRSALHDVGFHWDDAKNLNPKLADVHICHLRKEIMGTPFENMIETVWGRGFRLRTETEGPFICLPMKGRANAAKFYQVAA